MKNLVAIALLFALAFTTSAFADSAPAGVASDVGAVGKDNIALSKDDLALAQDRAAKAKDKASGNWVGQAIDSISIGADHVMRTEKRGEKSADTKILNHDVNDATVK